MQSTCDVYWKGGYYYASSVMTIFIFILMADNRNCRLDLSSSREYFWPILLFLEAFLAEKAAPVSMTTEKHSALHF